MKKDDFLVGSQVMLIDISSWCKRLRKVPKGSTGVVQVNPFPSSNIVRVKFHEDWEMSLHPWRLTRTIISERFELE